MKRCWLACLTLIVGAAAIVGLTGSSSAADSVKPTTTPAWEWGDPTLTPSGMFMPVGDVVSNGHTWHQIVAEDFAKVSATGSWANTACAPATVYTGASGVAWKAYPQACGWTDTWQHRPYRPDAVLSTNGVLDYWLHPVNGQPAGANISPVLPGGSQYQLYGRYSFRARFTTTDLADYYQAFLLWPQSDSDGHCGETDFPEAHVGLDHVNWFNHTCGGTMGGPTATLLTTDWHTYTVQWSPSIVGFSIDGVSVATTPNTFNLARRWQLQIETNTTAPNGHEGHYLIDWAVVYAY